MCSEILAFGKLQLWAYPDKVDFKELEKYGADRLSIALTADILNDLSIVTALNPKKPIVAALPEDAIKVSKLIFYGTAALIIFLSASTIYLIFKKRKRDEPNA